MLKWFCDRCGKRIKPYSGMKIKWERGVLQLEIKPWNGEDNGDCDLCDECSSIFKRWIENAEDNDTGEAAESE